MAANIFTGATDSNWGTSTNWSLSAVPTAGDGNPATFNAASPACTVNTSSRVCNGLDFRGAGVTDYANTITMSQQITCSGSVTLAAGMTIAGASALAVNATATLTSNGKTWPNALTLSGTTPTFTFADNWDVNGLLTMGTTTNTTTLNGSTINAGAGLTNGSSSGVVAGTTNIIMDGTGTITGASTTGTLRNNLTINTAGTITIASSVDFRYNTGTLTYVAGTVVTTSSTLNNNTVAVTLACAGITWNNVSLTGAVTVALSENLNLTGLLTIVSTTNSLVLTGSTINAGGGITFGGSSGGCSGTTVLNISGTGTLSMPSITNSRGILNAITINASGGTVTVSTVFLCDLGLLSYTSGKVIAGNTWPVSLPNYRIGI